MAIKLRDIYLFEWIDKDLIHFIVDNSRRVEYVVWDYIIHQWEKSDNVAYIIQEWKAEVEIDWKIINSLWEWDVFWEIALITNEERTASVRAVTDLVLLKINKDLLHKIIKEFKNWKEIQAEIIKRIKENHKSK